MIKDFILFLYRNLNQKQKIKYFYYKIVRRIFMIKLATVFSGIGAVEHALNRMDIDTEIVFACDNGDIDVLSKKIELCRNPL